MTNPFPTRSSSDLFEEAPAPAVAPPRIAREAVRVVLDHDKPAGGLAGPADSSRGQIVGRSLVELLHQDGAVGKMASAAVGLDAFRLRVDDVEFSRALLAQDRESTEIGPVFPVIRSEEHTSELQSLMRISYAVFCLKNKTNKKRTRTRTSIQKQ